MALQDFELVRDLLLYLNLHTVLVCWSAEDTDIPRFITFPSELWEEEIYFSFVFIDQDVPVSLPMSLSQEEKLLVVVGAGKGNSSCHEKLLPLLGLGSNVHWLLTGIDPLTNIPKELRLDSNWYTIHDMFGTHNSYRVKEQYRVKQGNVITSDLGSWTQEDGLKVVIPNKWERRSDLNGALLVNTVLNYDPLSILEKDRMVNKDRMDYDGFMADLFFFLKDRLNFTYSLTGPPDGEWGVLRGDSNGTFWTGMVGQLERKEADLCTAGLSVRLDRQMAIDYTTAVLEELVTLIVPKSPLTKSVDMWTYLVALKPICWVALLFWCLCMSVALSAINNLIPTTHLASFSNIVRGMVHGITLLFRSFLQLDSNLSPKSPFSFKMLFLTTWIMCFVSFQLYTGNMTASMTAGSSSNSLKSFQDVLQNTDYTVNSGKGAATEGRFIQSPEDTAMGQIYKKRLKLHSTDDQYVVNLINLVQSGRNVIFEAIYPFLGSQDLKVLMDFQERLTTQLGFGLQKDSELKALFDYHILKMRSTGFLSKQRNMWIERNVPQDYSHRIFVQDPLVLGFDNLFFPAFLLASGIMSSFIFCLAEKFYWRPKAELSFNLT